MEPRGIKPRPSVSYYYDILRRGIYIMEKLLIATNNLGKVIYYNNLFADLRIKIYSFSDIGIVGDEIEENGKDELTNARIKAIYGSEHSDMYCLGDDAGFYISALNGEPGLQTRRWGGRFENDVSDEKWLRYLLSRMEQVPTEERNGETRMGRALAKRGKVIETYRLKREFNILKKPNTRFYKPGLPASSVCVEKKYNKFVFELKPDERLYYEKDFLEQFKKLINTLN